MMHSKGEYYPIVPSETGLTAPEYWDSSNPAVADSIETEGSLYIVSGISETSLPHKVYRVMDDRLFVVEPDSPPLALA